jgi:hypothetical protein
MCGPVVLHASHCVFPFTGGAHDQILTGPYNSTIAACQTATEMSPDRPITSQVQVGLSLGLRIQLKTMRSSVVIVNFFS